MLLPVIATSVLTGLSSLDFAPNSNALFILDNPDDPQIVTVPLTDSVFTELVASPIDPVTIAYFKNVFVLGLGAFFLIVSVVCFLVALRSVVKRRQIGTLVFGLAFPAIYAAASVWYAMAIARGEVDIGEGLLQILTFPGLVASGSDFQTVLDLPLNTRILLGQLAALPSVLWLVFSARFTSKGGLAAGVVILIYVIGMAAAGEGRLAQAWIALLFTILVTILMIRLLAFIVVQNAQVFRMLGLWRTLLGLGQSAILWTPMLLLLLPFLWLDRSIRDGLKENLEADIYAELIEDSGQAFTDFFLGERGSEGFKGSSAAAINALALQQGKPDAVEIEDSIASDTRFLTAIKAASQIRAIRGEVAALKAQINTQLDDPDFSKNIKDIARASIEPSLEFQDPDNSGWFWGLKNEAERMAQSTANFSYGQMRSQIITLTGQLASATQASAQEKKAQVFARMDDAVRRAGRAIIDANDGAQRSLILLFAYLELAHQIGVVLFILVCIKSFFYVFSRVALHHRNKTWMTVGPALEAPAEPPQSRETGPEYTIAPAERPVRFFMSRSFAATGHAPRVAIPQAAGAPLGRIFKGKYALNCVDVAPGGTPVRYTSTRGATFLEWTLRKDEAVIIDLRNFVGMESSVTLSTLLSARFGTLVLNRFIFPVATGPGRLLLLADGRTEIVSDVTNPTSLSPDRILAIDLSTRLCVDSHNGFADIYLSNAYVRPVGGGSIVVNVDQQTSARFGLFQFATRFLWPF
ncbi:MAG: hypothetical protein AAGI09_06285 [Pseudomonadota bacterium]